MSQAHPSMTQHAAAAVILAALTILATAFIYWPGLSGPFVLDDIPNITAVHIDNIDLDGILYTISNNESGWLGRSVAMLSFVLTGILYGLEPWGYKFHNLLLHVMNGVLVFRLVWLLLPPLAPNLEERRRVVVSASLTALWMLHPLQVSTVLYVVQRMTELATFFSLLALLSYIEARNALHTRRFFVFAWLCFPLCMLLALLSKETGALIPLYVLAIEVFVFRDHGTWKQPRLAAILFAFVAAPLLAGSVYALANFDSLINYSTRDFTLPERLMTQLHVVALYARMILFPRLRDMGLYHDDFPITREFDPATGLLLLLLVAVCAAIWLLRRRAPVVSFGLAWFLVSHLLESTFIPLELMFEHRNYLAMVGLLLPPVYYIATARATPALQGVLAAYLLLMIFQTSSRALEWSNEELLLSVAVEEHPDSSRAHSFLANYLYVQGRIDEALEHVRRTEALDADNAGPSIHILGLQCRAGTRDEPALERATQRLRDYPISIYALNGLENILVWRGEKTCTELSADDMERLLAVALAQPRNASNPVFSGYLLRLRGVVNLSQQRYAQGVIDLRTAHELTGLPSIIGELVVYQVRLRRFEDAEETLAYLREMNAESHGLLTYLVDKHEAILKEGRATAANVPLEPASDATSTAASIMPVD